MHKPILACLAGLLLLAPAARADQGKMVPGRYQVIPDAVVPAKGRKAAPQAVLLDTATGRTWILSAGEFGSLQGPLWEPLRMEPGKPGETSASAAGSNKGTTGRKAPAVPQPAKSGQERPVDRYQYDDNP